MTSDSRSRFLIVTECLLLSFTLFGKEKGNVTRVNKWQCVLDKETMNDFLVSVVKIF